MLLIEGYAYVRSRKIDSGRESISGIVVEGSQQLASSTYLPLPYNAMADDELENGLTHMCWSPNRSAFSPRVSVPLSVLPAHTPCIAPSGSRLRMLWWQSCGPANMILPPHRVRCRQCYHLCLWFAWNAAWHHLWPPPHAATSPRSPIRLALCGGAL